MALTGQVLPGLAGPLRWLQRSQARALRPRHAPATEALNTLVALVQNIELAGVTIVDPARNARGDRRRCSPLRKRCRVLNRLASLGVVQMASEGSGRIGE
jgi:hypothetical protein